MEMEFGQSGRMAVQFNLREALQAIATSQVDDLLVQFFGSWLPVWDDLLPAYPDDLAQADAETVARALQSSYTS